MSINRIGRTCNDCPHYKEPVCAKLRPCQKNFPTCPDFCGLTCSDIYEPTNDTQDYSVEDYSGAHVTSHKPNGLPYVYIGLMRYVQSREVEIKEVGYKRVEMCPLDWEFLFKVGGIRRLCDKVKCRRGDRSILDADGIIRFYSCDNKLLAAYNTIVNAENIEYAKSQASWSPINCIGLYTKEFGGSPKFVYKLADTRKIPANKCGVFLSGTIEIPVTDMMSLTKTNI